MTKHAKALLIALPLALVALHSLAQPSLQVETTRQWVGELVFRTPKAVSFPFVNDGDSTLIIKDVHPSCGCVVASFTQTPIAPGEGGTITAEYDASMLGTFYRELAVYTNASERPIYLVLEGRVVVTPSDTDYDTDFPIDLGSLRLNTNVIEFDDVYKGDHPVAELLVHNMKKEDFTPQLMHLPQYLTAEYIPEMIQGGRTGKVRLTLDSDKLMMDGLNQSSIYMARFPGDKVSSENEIIFSAVLLPSFTNLTDRQMDLAPRIAVVDGEDTLTTKISLTNEPTKKGKKGKTLASKTVSVENNGEEELDISAVQVFNRAVSVSLGNRVIPPHGKTKLKVTVDLEELANTKNRPRLLIISNDPRSAKTLLSISMTDEQ